MRKQDFFRPYFLSELPHFPPETWQWFHKISKGGRPASPFGWKVVCCSKCWKLTFHRHWAVCVTQQFLEGLISFTCLHETKRLFFVLKKDLLLLVSQQSCVLFKSSWDSSNLYPESDLGQTHMSTHIWSTRAKIIIGPIFTFKHSWI